MAQRNSSDLLAATGTINLSEDICENNERSGNDTSSKGTESPSKSLCSSSSTSAENLEMKVLFIVYYFFGC